MIPVSEIKAWLEIDAADTSVDGLLLSLEAGAVEVIERETGRYFGPVAAFTEIVEGDGGPKLRLSEAPTEPPVTIEERAYAGAEARTITAADADGYELRILRHPSPNLAWLHRKGGCVWYRGHEFTVTYPRGYSAGNEPKNVRQRVLDIVQLKWLGRDAAGSGELRSETLGPMTFTYADAARLPERDGESWAEFVSRWQGWLF